LKIAVCPRRPYPKKSPSGAPSDRFRASSIEDANGTPASKHGLKWMQGFLGQSLKVTADYGVASIPQIMPIGPDGTRLAANLQGPGIRAAVVQALKGQR
jgi:hypothetical protein